MADRAQYVDTRAVPLRQLTRFPGNAKRGDVDVIAESIRTNGQYRSLVVRDTGDALVILAGNHTYDALTSTRAKTARCEIVTCDDQTARRINLVDNRSAELGKYDNDALVELLSYLDNDYTGTGWTADDVEALLTPPDLDDDEDLAAPALGQPVVSYQIVFDNEVQQERWYEYLRWLKAQFGDLDTIGERLHAHLGGLDF